MEKLVLCENDDIVSTVSLCKKSINAIKNDLDLEYYIRVSSLELEEENQNFFMFKVVYMLTPHLCVYLLLYLLEAHITAIGGSNTFFFKN